MEKNIIIDLCKEKLVTMNGTNPLLIPKVIENFARENPNKIICNEITEELATAIINRDRLKLMVLTYFGGLAHPNIVNLLTKDTKKGDSLLIHFYKEKSFYTCVIKFMYVCDSLIKHEDVKRHFRLCQKHGGIEYGSILAIAKVPESKKISERYLQDNNQEIFIKIAKRI